MQKTWEWIGLMSGSSLDGLDVAFCSFHQEENSLWKGQILAAETFNLPQILKKSLQDLPQASALDLAKTDSAFARFSASGIKKLVEKVGRRQARSGTKH